MRSSIQNLDHATLERILTLAAELATTHSLKETLEKIILTGTTLLDCDSVGVLLKPIEQDHNSQFLHFVAATQFESSLTHVPIPMNASIAGHVFLSGETIRLQYAHNGYNPYWSLIIRDVGKTLENGYPLGSIQP
ncbi:MAG: hypothetical protein OHK0052_27670 [Anaerolineales bacterium]